MFKTLGASHIDPYISYNCSSAIFISSDENKVAICRFPWWQEKPEIFVFSDRELIEAKIDSDYFEVSVAKEIQAPSNFVGITIGGSKTTKNKHVADQAYNSKLSKSRLLY